MSRYPTKQDIEKHTNQLVNGIRQYFRGYDKNKDFLKNGLRTLFTDILLESQNEGIDIMKVQINFDVLLKEMAK